MAEGKGKIRFISVSIAKELLEERTKRTSSGKLTWSYEGGKIRHIRSHCPYWKDRSQEAYLSKKESEIRLQEIIDNWAKKKYSGRVYIIWKSGKFILEEDQRLSPDDFNE